MKHEIILAIDTQEADEFAAWLNAKGHSATVGDTTGDTVDGWPSSAEEVQGVMEKLWNEYCANQDDTYRYEWNDDVIGFVVTNERTGADANLQHNGVEWSYVVDGGYYHDDFTDSDVEKSLADFNDQGIGEKLKKIMSNETLRKEFESGGSIDNVLSNHEDRLELAANATFDIKVSYCIECINECDFYDDDEHHSEQLRYAASLAHEKYGLSVFSQELQTAWREAIKQTVASKE